MKSTFAAVMGATKWPNLVLLGWIERFDGIRKVWKSLSEEVSVSRELKVV